MKTRRTVRVGDREWIATIEGATVSLQGVDEPFVIAEEPNDHLRISHPAGAPIDCVAVADGDDVWVGVEGHSVRFAVGAADSRTTGTSTSRARGAEAIRPPMSATVVRIVVKPGDAVHAGDTLVVLEAMKMELPIRASHDAVVATVLCHEGELVQPDTTLLELK
jgi:biotin carboxyl carrier protein